MTTINIINKSETKEWKISLRGLFKALRSAPGNNSGSVTTHYVGKVLLKFASRALLLWAA